MRLNPLPAAAVALALLSVPCAAQQQPMPSGPRNNFHNPSHLFSWERGHGFRGGFGGVFVVKREVPVIVEREAPPPPRAVPFPEQAQGGAKAPPRKPYVVGNSYASLPGGCMKMIEDGVSYYFCGGGEWYKQTGKFYRAVKREL